MAQVVGAPDNVMSELTDANGPSHWAFSDDAFTWHVNGDPDALKAATALVE